MSPPLLKLIFTILVLSVFSFAQESSDSEEATPVRKGVFTPRQREHSKLYDLFIPGGKKLTERMDGDYTLATHDEASYQSSAGPDLTAFAKKFTCRSDAVVLGEMISKESLLTERENFVFTDYTIRAENILKDDSKAPLNQTDDIVVTAAGGKIVIDKQTITVEFGGHHKLRPGEKYLLFLRRLPTTGAYTLVSGSSLISKTDGQLRKLGVYEDGHFPLDTNIAPVIGLVETFAAKPCEEKR